MLYRPDELQKVSWLRSLAIKKARTAEGSNQEFSGTTVI